MKACLFVQAVSMSVLHHRPSAARAATFAPVDNVLGRNGTVNPKCVRHHEPIYSMYTFRKRERERENMLEYVELVSEPFILSTFGQNL